MKQENSNLKQAEQSEYDYIVIGAGSAGCAIAARLSERADIRVLLIEAGPPDDHFLIHMPKGFPFLTRNLRYAWNFMTEPQPHRNFGPEMWPRGRMLGGSSSINGMIYSRGHPDDYESWVKAGNPGWGWSEVLRCFKEMEDHSLGESDTRGAGGPLHISVAKARSELSERFIEAGVAMGLRRSEDLNTLPQEAIGYCASTSMDGRRFSAARAYLVPARGRPNLRVVTETEVEKVFFENGRAAGVKARGPGGAAIYRARNEIVVSAGTILSPKLLMLSGIGDGAALQSMGIEVVHANPHVGAHMRDHVGVSLPHRMAGARGLNHQLHGLPLALNLLRYAMFREGVLSTAGEVGGFFRAHPDATRPDAQLGFMSLSLKSGPGYVLGAAESFPGFQAMGCALNATSEGAITLASPDPFANPRIQPNALSTARDQETVVAIVKFIRGLVEKLGRWNITGEEPERWRDARGDEQILRVALATARNFNHAVGACRMGREGEAVVDERLRVRGVAGLRVADCSVMPTLPAGNTNAPAQMVGWRTAKLILEDRERAA